MENKWNEYLCWDCKYPIKKNQKTCKNCWAELVWETTSEEIKTQTKYSKITQKIQNNTVLLWLTIMSWLILPIIWLIIWGVFGWWIWIKIWVIFSLIISIPISIIWIISLFKNIKPTKITKEDFSYSNWNFTIRFVILLWWYIFLREKWVVRDDIVVWILFIRPIIKRPLIFICWLAIIYWIVKFIKRARNN